MLRGGGLPRASRCHLSLEPWVPGGSCALIEVPRPTVQVVAPAPIALMSCNNLKMKMAGAI